MSCFAWTPPTGPGYPPYFNVSRIGDDIKVIMREAPTVRENGIHICSHEPGSGRCVKGGPTCNNYCNMHPNKANMPMPDRPMPCTQVFEGKYASILIPIADWTAMGLPLPPV